MLQKIILTLKSIKNLHIFVFEFLGIIKNQDIIYHTYNGSKMLVRAGSTDSAEIIIINGDLEYPRHHFPIKNKQTVVDIGANIGAFSVYLSYSLPTKPRIYALEPSKENFRYLKKNINLNDLSNVSCHNIAISNKSGTADLDTSTNPDSYALLDTVATGTKTEAVETQTLSDFCESMQIEHIDLLKIDVEGGEYKIFEEAINFIKENVSVIFIELHDIDENKTMKKFEQKYIAGNFTVKDRIMNRTLILENLNNK